MNPLTCALLTLLTAAAPARANVRVSPATVVLDSPEASQQLLVTIDAAGQPQDGTRSAAYEVADATIATVDSVGMVTPRAEGKTEIRVRHGSDLIRVPVEVTGLSQPRPISFEQEIIPILTKAAATAAAATARPRGRTASS